MAGLTVRLSREHANVLAELISGPNFKGDYEGSLRMLMDLVNGTFEIEFPVPVKKNNHENRP